MSKYDIILSMIMEVYKKVEHLKELDSQINTPSSALPAASCALVPKINDFYKKKSDEPVMENKTTPEIDLYVVPPYFAPPYKCIYTLTRGNKKGEHCNKKTVESGCYFCSSHKKFEEEMQDVIDKKDYERRRHRSSYISKRPEFEKYEKCVNKGPLSVNLFSLHNDLFYNDQFDAFIKISEDIIMEETTGFLIENHRVVGRKSVSTFKDKQMDGIDYQFLRDHQIPYKNPEAVMEDDHDFCDHPLKFLLDSLKEEMHIPSQKKRKEEIEEHEDIQGLIEEEEDEEESSDDKSDDEKEDSSDEVEPEEEELEEIVNEVFNDDD